MTLTAQDRARRIKIILFDVDGVLTDGGIWFVPVPGTDGTPATKMVEFKGYSAHDGAGLRWRAGRDEVRVITKRISDSVALRARDLKMEFVYQGRRSRCRRCARSWQGRRDAGRIAYVGDDVIDLPAMRAVGWRWLSRMHARG